MMLGMWLKNNYTRVQRSVFVLCCLPGVATLYQYLTGQLNEDPLNQLTHLSGRFSIIMLAATLAVTPSRRLLCTAAIKFKQPYGKRLSDWNWLIKLRRMLGLWSFFYATNHVALYVIFDIDFDLHIAVQDAKDNPYLLTGFVAMILLSLLALTSIDSLKRRLGRFWMTLHKTIYLIAVLVLLHFWWSMKPGILTPLSHSVVIAILLGYRLALKIGLIHQWDGYQGNESTVRPDKSSITDAGIKNYSGG